MRTIGLALLAWAAFAQQNVTFEGHPALEMANDRITLTITKTGGSMNRVVLNDDAEKLSPLWDPIRAARELGQERRQGTGGHFVCVDGFGPVSAEEKAAGLPGHGEAHSRPMAVVTAAKSGHTMTVKLGVELPIVREKFTRTFRLVDGENVVYVESEIENLLGFDRPVIWAEHATIGSPFLAPEVTVVDLSAGPSQTRPYPEAQRPRRRLEPGRNFTWPMAPAKNGELINLRAAPAHPDSLDHTTSLMDTNRELEFATALNVEKHLLVGWVFRRQEYPWLQTWENYPPTPTMARGLEFSTQPYDVPRRESLSLGKMFGAPTYRWLPAKSRISTRFLLFYVRAPEGFRKVDDVRLRDGKLVIENRIGDLRIVLAASQGL